MRLRHYLYIVSLVALSACNSEELNTSDTADGEIRLSAATIEGSTAVTTRTITPGSPKALTEGTAIALQVSGTWTGKSNPDIVKTPKATAADATIAGKSDLTLSPALYWDDFGTADPNNKDTGRANGLTIYGAAMDGVTDETKAPNVGDWTALSWNLGADQTSGISTKDLLLSNNVSGTNTYKFSDSSKQLEFKHVLSKITVNILAGDGFDGKFTNAPEVVLTSNEANSTTNTEWAYTKGIFNVTTGELSLEDTDLNTVTMAQAGTNGNTVTMEALVMPGSIFASDAATIMRINADGNIYYITAKKIREATGLTLATNDVYTLKAGKNYIFKVRVNKTGVEVTATVKDWDTVDSEEETPAISFTADVTSSSNTTTGSNLSNDASLKSGDSFSLWMSTDKSSFGSIATTATYNADDSKFVNSPTIYWPNSSTSYYFRALAQKTDTHTLEAVTTTAVSQGTDLLWGTTAAHTGTEADGTTTHDYAESAIINPRTGAVPLIFKHAMSNVVVELSTSTDAASEVNLTDATVTMSNLYTNGKIDIAGGTVSVPDDSEKSTVTVSGETIMVPQTIGDTSKMTITLKDGTTYSLQLNTCTCKINGVDTPIASWAGGSKYTYKIYLEKEAMKFSVTITGWDPVYGSGNATLDWD